MADKVFESDGHRVPLKNKMLSGDVSQLVIGKMHGVDNVPRSKEVCIRILEKRKQKWRKRHKLSQEPDSQHLSISSHQEIASKIELTETVLSLQVELTLKRNEALKAVRQLQIEKWDQCLEAICHRLKKAGESLLALQTTKQSSTTVSNSLVHVDQHQIIKDLQTAIVQAKALKDIQKMKLYMTPRMPFSHEDHIVEGDMSLFPLDDGHISDGLTDSSDSGNIPVAITTEVSTTSLCNDLVQEVEDDNVDKSSLLTHAEQDNTHSLPSSTTADISANHIDAPGISVGMEVVCMEGHSGLAIGSSSHNEADTDIVMASSRDPSNSPDSPDLPGLNQVDTLGNSSLMLNVATTNTKLEPTSTPHSKRKKRIKTSPSQNSYLKKPKLNHTLFTPVSSTMTDAGLSDDLACELGETDDLACELGETDDLGVSLACELGETDDLACELGETDDLGDDLASELGETDDLCDDLASELGETDDLSDDLACEAEDSDSQMCTLLQVLERAPYELRVPKRTSGGLQTYSFDRIKLTSSTSLKNKRKQLSSPKGTS